MVVKRGYERNTNTSGPGGWWFLEGPWVDETKILVGIGRAAPSFFSSFFFVCVFFLVVTVFVFPFF